MHHGTYKPLYLYESSLLFIEIFKDLPLLDCVGSKYPFRYHSFINGNRIHRSVTDPIFIWYANFNLMSLATWLGSDSQLSSNFKFPSGAALWTSVDKWLEGSIGVNFFPLEDNSGRPLDPLMIISFALSMAVNALVTALIVLKILKVFLEVEPTPVERNLDETGRIKLRHIVFIIVESGMALFAVQLVRVVLSCLPLNTSTILAFNLTIGINQMFNVIIISVHSSSFILLITLTWLLGHRTNNNFGADFNEIARRWRWILQGNCRITLFL